jgi:F-type H+-transporting ATPase subunit b
VDAVEAIVAKLSGVAPDRATVAARVKAELANG